MKRERSDTIYKDAELLMPGGVSSPVRAFKAVNNTPVFINEGRGATITDVDGNTYIDYVMSFGPLILGHAPKRVIDALSRRLQRGTSYGAPVEEEVELARIMVERNSALKWVRFVNSGTEAVMSAIRLARGATGRDKIVKFAGCYHGHYDPLLVKSGSGLATFSIASSAGIPKNIVEDTLVVSLGDLESLKQVFEMEGDKIAAVIIEGIPANMGLFPQSIQFLKAVQSLCRTYGSLFIFDEVITGFRVARGGAVEYYGGLEPDIITYGKIIGGGLPVGAYGGREDLLDLVSPNGNVYQAGTLSGNPLAMTAGISTVTALDEEVYTTLERRTERLTKGMKDLAQQHGIPAYFMSVGSLMWMALQEKKPASPDDITELAVKRFALLHHGALQRGVYLPPSAYEVFFLSTAHEEETIEDTLSKIEPVLKQLSEVRL